MDNLITILPILISLLALVISFMNYLNEKRKVTSDIVTADRIKWISNVRELMGRFLEVYIADNDATQLRIIKSQIDLYIMYDKEAYDSFEKKLSYCISNPYSEKNYRDLVKETQLMLNGVWGRIKDEAGITQRDEKNKINAYKKRRAAA